MMLLAACLLPARPCPAATFNYVAAPVDVSPGTTGSWQDVDVSSSVPSGATGVILQVVNTSGTAYAYGVRKNGSTDTWMTAGNSAYASEHRFLMIGVDANRIFECYTGNAAVDTYLVGYTESGVTFFTNAIDKSLTVTDTWTDVNISANTGADTAIGGIFIVKGTGTGQDVYGLRKKGSTDNRNQLSYLQSAHGAWIGVDGSEVCQMTTEELTVDLYLVGYVTSGAVFFTNAVNKSIASTGSYVDVDITANIGSDDASGALVEVHSNNGNFYNTAFRPKGAIYDYYSGMLHTFAIVGIDAADIFEHKIANPNLDIYLLGYTLAGSSPPSIASAASQTFFTGDPTTAISQITITDSSGGEVTAANDLRVRLPAGFNMTWDSADTTAVIGGTASGKVSATVSYEDADATLVLNVISAFTAGETASVSGLGFESFTAVSSSDNLELEVYNDGNVTATDDKTIEILVTPTPCGSPFCYLDTPVNITPSVASSWEDVNVSAYVPSGATGVILQAQGDGASNRNFGVRKNGSSDTWMPSGNNLVSTQQHMYMIGVDSNLILEVYTAGTSVKTWLVGYTMNGVTFFTNAVDKSLGSTSVPVAMNISADTGADTAIGAIIIVKNTGGLSRNYFLRKYGSTDFRYLHILANTTCGAIIGVDGNEICEGQIANGAVDMYLVGYVTAGAVFFTNETDKSTATVGSYVDVDITSDIGSDDANGAIVEWASSDNTTRNWALRREGATFDHYLDYRHLFGIVAIDSGDVFEQKISTTVMDLYLIGYTLAGTPLAISSDENQVFEVADSPTAASAFTISDTMPAVINTTDDIRVQIPAGFDMTWNPSVTAVTISGPAAAKVSATVAYEDSDATLVLDVTSDFTIGDSITVSGLGFIGFTALSAQDNLELDVDNDGTADATDDKTIQIGPSGTTYYVRTTGNDGANGLTPATAWETINKAATTLVAGDWAYVGAGSYSEQLAPTNDGTSADPIRFLGDTDGSKTGDAGTVEITSAGTVVLVSGDNYIEVARFTLSGGTRGAEWSGSTGGVLANCDITGMSDRGVSVVSASALEVTGCDIHDGLADGVAIDGGSTATVEQCSVHDNGTYGLRGADAASAVTLSQSRFYGNADDGVRAAGGTWTVVNCLIYGNTASGVYVSPGPATLTMWHCTIEGNDQDGYKQALGTGTVRNSIIASNTNEGIELQGGTLDHTYNLVWGNSTNFLGTSADPTEISANPQFISATNWHLKSSSPAIDAGTDASSVTAEDLDGGTRPQASGWDMGCYEGTSGSPRILTWREVQP